MARHAIIEDATGVVVNIIEIDDASEFTPAPGRSVVWSSMCSSAEIGGVYDGSGFTPPTITPEVDPLAGAKAKCAAYFRDASITALITADPSTLNVTQRQLRETAIAVRALMRIVRLEMTDE
jgi:hypothetical protein